MQTEILESSERKLLSCLGLKQRDAVGCRCCFSPFSSGASAAAARRGRTFRPPRDVTWRVPLPGKWPLPCQFLSLSPSPLMSRGRRERDAATTATSDINNSQRDQLIALLPVLGQRPRLAGWRHSHVSKQPLSVLFFFFCIGRKMWK